VGAVSVRDVALRAGVSVGTVSNVLNRPDRVHPSTLAKVHAAIAELGFVRNDAARQLRAGRSSSLGLIVPDVRNPFFTDIARGVEDRATAAGLAVLLGNSENRADRESIYLDLFEEQRVHGVLISPHDAVDERLQRLRARGIPAVLIDRADESGEFSSVTVDDVAGGRLAAEHVLALGRRRVAFVGGPGTLRQVADRLDGVRRAVDAVADAHLEVIAVDATTVPEGRRAGVGIAGRAPSDRPDAILAANDLLAVGVLHALVMHGGVRVPDDVAVVGYDDIDFAATAIVPLTSVRQPSVEIGATGVDLLLEQAADPALAPRQVVFAPELVVRASTGQPPRPTA
jgi:LacI family transcriptional regulator